MAKKTSSEGENDAKTAIQLFLLTSHRIQGRLQKSQRIRALQHAVRGQVKFRGRHAKYR